MSRIPAHCTEEHRKRRFVLKENRSQVTFLNPGQHAIEQTQVDGCAIVDGLRCDSLVGCASRDASVLVELKGSDVHHAFKQLERSHETLRPALRKEVTWIVCTTRCPLASTEIQTLALKVRKRLGATVVVRNSPVEHTL